MSKLIQITPQNFNLKKERKQKKRREEKRREEKWDQVDYRGRNGHWRWRCK
jgi:hypothetical protein